MVAVAKKETSARFLGQPGLSGGQPGRACPVFSACLACSQKISAAPVGKAFQRLRKCIWLVCFEAVYFSKAYSWLLGQDSVGVLSGMTTFPKPKLLDGLTTGFGGRNLCRGKKALQRYENEVTWELTSLTSTLLNGSVGWYEVRTGWKISQQMLLSVNYIPNTVLAP